MTVAHKLVCESISEEDQQRLENIKLLRIRYKLDQQTLSAIDAGSPMIIARGLSPAKAILHIKDCGKQGVVLRALPKISEKNDLTQSATTIARPRPENAGVVAPKDIDLTTAMLLQDTKASTGSPSLETNMAAALIAGEKSKNRKPSGSFRFSVIFWGFCALFLLITYSPFSADGLKRGTVVGLLLGAYAIYKYRRIY